MIGLRLCARNICTTICMKSSIYFIDCMASLCDNDTVAELLLSYRVWRESIYNYNLQDCTTTDRPLNLAKTVSSQLDRDDNKYDGNYLSLSTMQLIVSTYDGIYCVKLLTLMLTEKTF